YGQEVTLVCPVSVQTRMLFPGVAVVKERIPQENAWDVLERFAGAIASCERPADQRRLALDVVREALDADVIYWYPGSSGDALEIVGDRSPSPAWCSAFAARLLAETPGVGGSLLRSVVSSGRRVAANEPHSAILVRVSKSRSIWIVALSFNERRRFQV